MPEYPYRCPGCSKDFYITKSARNIDDLENCPSCGTSCNKNHRLIARPSLHDIEVGEAQWDVALGCVVKNNKHRAKIAKERGLEEIGNESVDNIIKHFDDQKSRAAKERYREFFDPIELRSR